MHAHLCTHAHNIVKINRDAFQAKKSKHVDLLGLGLDFSGPSFPSRMISTKCFVQVFEGKSVVLKEFFVVPVMFGHVDTCVCVCERERERERERKTECSQKK